MDREQELRRQIAEAHHCATTLFHQATEHLFKQLASIEARKRPPPITTPDGRTFIYNGPIPDETPSK